MINKIRRSLCILVYAHIDWCIDLTHKLWVDWEEE